MTPTRVTLAALSLVLVNYVGLLHADFRASDPGVRGGSADAGDPFPGLTPAQRALFDAGKDDFVEVDGIGEGLGPRFNLDSCAGCHTQPAVGGTSPAVNPQVAGAAPLCARNARPFFTAPPGPRRAGRVKSKPHGPRGRGRAG